MSLTLTKQKKRLLYCSNKVNVNLILGVNIISLPTKLPDLIEKSTKIQLKQRKQSPWNYFACERSIETFSCKWTVILHNTKRTQNNCKISQWRVLILYSIFEQRNHYVSCLILIWKPFLLASHHIPCQPLLACSFYLYFDKAL